MIEYAAKQYDKKDIEAILNPFVKQWFSKFRELTPPQKYAIKLIHENKNTLISSPTGSGKTVSAFLSIINELFQLSEKGELEDNVYCLYISPLKALNNDIYVNLQEPLNEIRSYSKNLPEVRVAVRTGDTTQSERSKQARKAPHILVTTPESLAILLNSPKFISNLANLQWLIIDEIHALCSNKRGVHLSLSIERLRAITNSNFTRIGLSATIHPLDEVAKYLVGKNGNCFVVNTRFIRDIDIKLSTPVSDLIYTPTVKVTNRFYNRLNTIIGEGKTSLIFTNTRSGTERILFNLQKEFRNNYLNNIGAHHSSLSKEQRLDVENKLKKGELKAVCSSTSLELGIDIGYIDQVIQVASPKSISRLLQRIGRAGHKMHETSIGKILVNDRDDLIECGVMIEEAYKGKIDGTAIPRNCLDVLSQHIMGMSLTKKWSVDDALKIIKKSYCYSELEKEDFISVLRYLSGKNYELDGQGMYSRIWFDQIEEMFGRKGRNARLIYFLNLGTIPDSASVKVYANNEDSSKELIGSLDEDFVEKLRGGDRFVIGGKTYEFEKARGMAMTVNKAWDKEPTIPSWASEMLPLSFDLAIEIGKFRNKIFTALRNGEDKETIMEMIKRSFRADDNATGAIVTYIEEQYRFMKYLMVENHPSHKTILVENYFENEQQNIIIHSMYGRRVNDVLSRSYAYSLGRKLKKNIGITINDNGFILTLPKGTTVEITDVIACVTSNNIEALIRESLEKTEILKRRFRHVAARGLMILRNYNGNRISVGKQQISAGTLFEISKEIPDFPLIKEVYREILEDAMDIKSARAILQAYENGNVKFEIARRSNIPSPFAYNLVLKERSDVITTEGKRELLERMHKEMLRKIKD